MSLERRTDAPAQALESKIDPRTGVLTLRYAPTWVGVRKYTNPDGSVSRELHRPEQVHSPGFLATVKRLVCPIDHPTVDGAPAWVSVDGAPGSVRAQDVAAGFTGEEIEARPAGEYGAEVPTVLVTVFSDLARRLILGGLRESSLGYDTYVDRTPGVWVAPDGSEHPYDAEHVLDPSDPRIAQAVADGILTAAQAARLGANHLAIAIPAGRGGVQSRLRLDAAGEDYTELQRFTFGLGRNSFGVPVLAQYVGDERLFHIPASEHAIRLGEDLAQTAIWSLSPKDDSIPLRTDLAEPRRFYLRRDEDVHGKSGTGRVADGILWGDGCATIRWRTETCSETSFASLGDLEAIHGHEGRTPVVWIDPPLPPGTASLSDAVAPSAGDLPAIEAARSAERHSYNGLVAGWESWSEGPWGVAFWAPDGSGLLWRGREVRGPGILIPAQSSEEVERARETEVEVKVKVEVEDDPNEEASETAGNLVPPPGEQPSEVVHFGDRAPRAAVATLGDVSTPTTPAKRIAVPIPAALRRADAMASIPMPEDAEALAALDAFINGVAAEIARLKGSNEELQAQNAQMEETLSETQAAMEDLKADAAEGKRLRLERAQARAKALGVTPTADSAEGVEAEVVKAKAPNALSGLKADSPEFRACVRSAFLVLDSLGAPAPAAAQAQTVAPGLKPLTHDRADLSAPNPAPASQPGSLRARAGKVR